jgi:hypothetical protein
MSGVNAWLLACIHVDDILFFSNNNNVKEWFVIAFTARFILGAAPIHCVTYLAARIKRFDHRKTTTVDVQAVAERFTQLKEGIYPKRKPLPVDHEFTVNTDPVNEPRRKRYAENTGKINYMCTKGRPDLAHAAQTISHAMHNPTEKDEAALTHCLGYITRTSHYRLRYSQTPPKVQLGVDNWITIALNQIYAYVDSDWAQDKPTRRSTSGFVIFLNGAPIAWFSHLQTLVTFSSGEAEYCALSSCCREILYLRHLLRELGFTQTAPTKIFIDSSAALVIATKKRLTEHNKHIDLREMKAREMWENKEIEPVKINRKYNVADLLTKNSKQKDFDDLIDLLMDTSPMEQ